MPPFESTPAPSRKRRSTPSSSIFERVFGRATTLVFSAEETAREVAETLERKGIANDFRREGSVRFGTTGEPADFRVLGERFLQLPIGNVEQVSIADLELAAA